MIVRSALSKVLAHCRYPFATLLTFRIDFSKPRGALLGLLNAILALGCICGTPFISMVGDRWGRRMGIFFGSVIMAVGGIIQGVSVNSQSTPICISSLTYYMLIDIYPVGMFLFSRFLIGFGLVFANTYAPVLIGELAHPKDRMVITSLYQTSWVRATFLSKISLLE
jgi:MFS family permease